MNKYIHVIKSVEENSIGEELGLEPGDAIVKINGNEIRDIFDYHYLIATFEKFLTVKHLCAYSVIIHSRILIASRDDYCIIDTHL